MAKRRSSTSMKPRRKRDAKKRPKSEQTLAKSTAGAIVESIREPSLMLDAQPRVLTANKSFCEKFRVVRQDVEERPFFELSAGRWNVPQLRKLIRSVLRKGPRIENFELDYEFAVGERRRLVLNACPLVLKDANTPIILITIEDVTGRKAAEEAIRESRPTTYPLLELAPQAILAVNANGRIVLVNGVTEKMFGYRRKELLGQPLDLLVPENIRNHHVYYREFLANPRSRPMGLGLDLSGRRKDGTLFPVEISLGCIDVAEGRLAVAFVSDIIERRRLEAAVKADHEEIRALASRLLAAQEEERRRVAREIHDDFCQQLAALAFDVGGLVVEPLPDAIRARLQSLQARLVALSTNGRHLAHRLHPSTLEDLGLAVSLQALCEESSHRKGVVVKFRSRNVPGALPMEVRSCLYRIAQEGLRNAIEHSSAKHVRAALVGKENTVRLSIRDDGIGFDPPSAKRKGGLGLVSMEERVRLINGKLSIKSTPGHGARIVVTAPLFGGSR